MAVDLMDAVGIVFLMWIALGIAFVAGCFWNSGAYQRGYEDGYKVGYNNALGRELPR